MSDPTENIRRGLVEAINTTAQQVPDARAHFESRHGKVWDTKELQQDFEVLSFAAPFVVVRRKSDGAMGSMLFSHSPRFYFSFTPDSEVE
jgi:hypothetical protein